MSGLTFQLRVPTRNLDVSGRVEPGVTGLLGANGAGKTSLLHALAGLLPSHGPIGLGGRPLHTLPPERRGIGLVFQDLRLFPHLTVRRNVAFGATSSVDDVLERFHLTGVADRRVTQLSGGQRQSVALARAFATRPGLLLLDEPTSALSPQRRRSLLADLRAALMASPVPCLLVTHRPEDLLVLTDRLLVLDGDLRPAAPLHADAPEAVVCARRAGVGQAWPVDDSDCIDGVPLVLPPRPTGATHVHLRPEDVIITRPPFGPTSARNPLDGRVVRIVPAGEERLVQLDVGVPLTAAITQRAVDELGLGPGATVRAWVKTTAFRWL